MLLDQCCQYVLPCRPAVAARYRQRVRLGRHIAQRQAPVVWHSKKTFPFLGSPREGLELWASHSSAGSLRASRFICPDDVLDTDTLVVHVIHTASIVRFHTL
jgi:hypothetical protein